MDILTVQEQYRERVISASTSVVDLRGADLSEANLIGADLSKAYLRGADLSKANLIGADLSKADLSGADLSEANLSGADLSKADLSGAALSGADLSTADLRETDLRGADLREADLRGANLRVFQAGAWVAYITSTHIRIGCQMHPTEDWKGFSSQRIEQMCAGASQYWDENKAIIFAIAETLSSRNVDRSEAMDEAFSKMKKRDG